MTGHKGKGPQRGGPPPPPRSITTALGAFPLDTCHLRSLGRPRSQKAPLPGCGGLVFGDTWEISPCQNGFCGGERTHNGEALAVVVRLGYFQSHFALFALGARFGLTRLLVLSNISTFHQNLPLRRRGRRVSLLFPTCFSNRCF